MKTEAMNAEKARSLAHRLKKQTDKYLEACRHVLLSHKEIKKKGQSISIEAAVRCVTAFQIVHTSALMAGNYYLDEHSINELSGVIAEILYGNPDDKWMEFLQHYEDNKKQELSEQFVKFSEDVAVAMTGSAAGMVIGPSLAIMAKEFYIRNLGLVAEHFGDKKTTDVCIEAIKAIHTKKE